MRWEIVPLERQECDEKDAETRTFRLAAWVPVSEEIYKQEVGLIRTKQRWIMEQKERMERQYADLERYRFNPQSIGLLHQRLETRLTGATLEDKRFVLEAVGAMVMVQADRTWELELQVLRDMPIPEPEPLQIVNSTACWPIQPQILRYAQNDLVCIAPQPR